MGCLKLAYYQPEPQLKVVYRKPEPQKKTVQMWLSVDPLAVKYPSYSPYLYVAGNPVRLFDTDGKKIYDGANEVKVEYDASGNITYSLVGGGAVSDEFKNNGGRLLSAMAETSQGREMVDFLANSSTEFHINITNESHPKANAESKEKRMDGEVVYNSDDLYESVTITIFMGSMDETYSNEEEFLNESGVVEANQNTKPSVYRWRAVEKMFIPRGSAEAIPIKKGIQSREEYRSNAGLSKDWTGKERFMKKVDKFEKKLIKKMGPQKDL